MAKFIERWTFEAKSGCKLEMIKLVKAMVEGFGLTPRVCTYMWGSYDIVISDLEFETEEDRQKFWDTGDWNQPANVEWMSKWTDLTESHGRELLEVH